MTQRRLVRLLEIMAALRTPETGCAWDLEQTFASIARYTIEEAYELADAIERGDLADLKDELGDLLLQVVFHARLAQEQEAFDFGDVVDAISEKLIRRHPHVFGDAISLSPSAVAAQWNAIKAQERERTREANEKVNLLDGVPLALPALTRAVKLQEKAGKVGFDWANAQLVLAKIREETEEVIGPHPTRLRRATLSRFAGEGRATRKQSVGDLTQPPSISFLRAPSAWRRRRQERRADFAR